jgi:hypothetical protein
VAESKKTIAQKQQQKVESGKKGKWKVESGEWKTTGIPGCE